MKKVVVLGCSGSGKSTFSLQLHNATGLPLYHLDNVWWKPDRTHITRDEFDKRLDDLVNRDSWIIDGDYSRTYEKRIGACDTIIAYEPHTASDCRRLITACKLTLEDLKKLVHGLPTDSGLAGKVKECLHRDARSRITRVQAQGRNDAYLVIDGKRYPLEVKTNGGRIESLYKSKAPDTHFIVYELDVMIKAGKPRKDGTCKPAEHRQTCKVMTVRKFLEVIESTGASKVIGHGEADREVAVQADSKKLYQALISGGFIDYDREATYTWEQFTR